ncbi:MAG: glycosyltransferase family 2 protein [Armatimonadia bacterium]
MSYAAEPVRKLSLVLPVYNEVDNIEPLYEALSAALARLALPAEVVLVNDGSRDGSTEKLDAVAERDDRFVAVHLRRNFGQTAAMAAGFDQATGDVIIALDADLQNDPNDIPLLLDKINEGYDVVSGWRRDRQDKWLTRILPSKMANWLISKMTGVYLHDYGCSLKAYRREILQDVKLYGEMHRYIPALAYWAGARVGEVVVTHHARKFGQSKYGLSRTLKVVLDLLTVKFLLAYSTKPIQVFGRWGLMSGAAGFLLALYLSLERLVYGTPLANRPALLLAVLLMLLGVQFVSMGLIAELQARTYYEAQDKKIYAIRRVTRRGE